MTPLEAAKLYLSHGWQPIPIPDMHKGPVFAGWQEFKITSEEAPEHFNGKPQNIGVRLGEPSGGLVDIDLDCPEASRLAPRLLPETQIRLRQILDELRLTNTRLNVVQDCISILAREITALKAEVG